MTPYLSALRDAMSKVAALPSGIIMGQSILAGGTALRRTTDHIPPAKLLEMPVMEDSQLGMSIGMALAGMTVVSCYPRWNFLLLAANQLVNHLDKLPLMAGINPHVLVRVVVPNPVPLNPGHQHLGDFTEAFELMLKKVEICELYDPYMVEESYSYALANPGAYLMVEYSELYDKV